jgi:hypothetical protein
VPHKEFLPGKKDETNFKLVTILNEVSRNESVGDVYVLCCYNCEKMKQQKEISSTPYTAVGFE